MNRKKCNGVQQYLTKLGEKNEKNQDIKNGNQRRGSKNNLEEGQCPSFYYTLSPDLLRVYTRREEGGGIRGKANQIV